jgi:hypothetical protein
MVFLLVAPPCAGVARAPDLGARLRPLLGRPYGADAVTDAKGRTVTFADPERALPAPALNCSGFLVEAARRVLGFAGSPADAARDRRGDSGPAAARGLDWDFGYDLALNLSEGRPRRWITAEGPAPASAEAARLAAWRVQDEAAWQGALAALAPGHLGLATLRRGIGHGLRFHHVAVVLKDAQGRAWFYQTLPQGRVHRLDLSSPEGFARLCTMFGPGERVLLLDVEAVTAP